MSDLPEPVIVALDVGGTQIKGAIRDADGAETFLDRWPTPRDEGPAAVVAAVLDATRDLLGRVPDAAAIGLVVPGLVDDANGVGVY